MGGHRRGGVLLFVALAAACNRGLSKDSYAWNPTLAATQGKLDGLVGDLPFGNATAVTHHHPLDDDRTFVMTNGDRLLPFVHKPNVDATLAYATAFYDEKGTVSGAVDAELLKDGQEVPLTKEKSYVGDNASLFAATPKAIFQFYLRPVRGLLAGDATCRLYVAESEAGSFVVLVGQERNLYVELAVSGTLRAAKSDGDSFEADSWKWEESAPAKPFEAVRDWTQEPLRKLRDASAKMRLGVCTLPP